LDYAHRETVSGELRCRAKDTDKLKKMFKLMAKNQINHKFSYNHPAFCVLTSFGLDLKISTLGDHIRIISFYPEEMYELLQCVKALI
jgi:hypothetical protein